MKEVGIREMAKQVEEFADMHLMDQEGCAAVIDNEIVLCIKNDPAYLVTGTKFDASTPRMLMNAGISIINRIIFDLGPEETSAIIASTMPKPRVHRRNKQQLAFSV
jgi:hypothetical protein